MQGLYGMLHALYIALLILMEEKNDKPDGLMKVSLEPNNDLMPSNGVVINVFVRRAHMSASLLWYS